MERGIRADEVSKHNTPGDCWVIVQGMVYDVTPIVRSHPGGSAVIARAGGKDATKEWFRVFHSKRAEEQLASLIVGRLVEAVRYYDLPWQRLVLRNEAWALAFKPFLLPRKPRSQAPSPKEIAKLQQLLATLTVDALDVMGY